MRSSHGAPGARDRPHRPQLRPEWALQRAAHHCLSERARRDPFGGEAVLRRASFRRGDRRRDGGQTAARLAAETGFGIKIDQYCFTLCWRKRRWRRPRGRSHSGAILDRPNAAIFCLWPSPGALLLSNCCHQFRLTRCAGQVSDGRPLRLPLITDVVNIRRDQVFRATRTRPGYSLVSTFAASSQLCIRRLGASWRNCMPQRD